MRPSLNDKCNSYRWLLVAILNNINIQPNSKRDHNHDKIVYWTDLIFGFSN